MKNDPQAIGADAQKVPRIDSHQHFWQRDRGDYYWLTPDLGLIYRDFLPDDLRPELSSAGIDRTVLIQAASTEQETDFMLDLAEKTDFVVGVVGWVNMESPNVVQTLKHLTRNPFFKGIRPMIQDIENDQWMLSPSLGPAFSTLIDLGLCFDALVKPQHLPSLHRLLLRYPELKVVIDHGAKPDISSWDENAPNSQFEWAGYKWAEDLNRIAEDTRAYCKLSGLVTEASHMPNYEDVNPYMRRLYEYFGPNRLMWGSDWPVVNLASNYQKWATASAQFISTLDQDSQAAIWSGTASSFYSL